MLIVFARGNLQAQNKLVFNFWKLNLKLGPWKLSFDIKRGDKDAPCAALDRTASPAFSACRFGTEPELAHCAVLLRVFRCFSSACR